MPLILNIETATEVCSVCLSKGKEVLSLKESDKEYTHASIITRLIEECCTESGFSLSQIDAVAISKGPGSYTSLRVGASTAKGICYALDKPLIAIDTLESIAHATFKKERLSVLYAPMIDARRMEVYAALYDMNMNVIEKTNALIVDAGSFTSYFKQGKTIIFSGNGAPKCNNVINSPLAIFSDVICAASHLSILSFEAFKTETFVDIAYFSPYYFKAPNITIPRKIL